MKITGETKLKELIRDEFELDLEKKLIFINTNLIEIPIKRKKEKTFVWYIHEYLNKRTFVEKHTKENIRNECWDVVEFEIVIGLLKFICDDLEIKEIAFELLLNELRLIVMNDNVDFVITTTVHKITNICPKIFLKSLFK